MSGAVDRVGDYAPADETSEIKPDNLLWKQYVVYADLFEFYVDIYFDHAGGNNPFRGCSRRYSRSATMLTGHTESGRRPPCPRAQRAESPLRRGADGGERAALHRGAP
jgi:hypothetical protein